MEPQIKNGLIHVHSELSTKDGTASVDRLVSKAASLGAPAITLTDHGTMFGVYPFMHACEQYHVKGVPGIEAYIFNRENDGDIRRAHMLILPKTYVGYQGITKAVTLSNQHLTAGFPEMDFKILNECFGVGTPAHGQVIATSACMGGVIAQILLKNRYIDYDIAKAEKKLEGISGPDDPNYLDAKQKLSEAHDAVQKLIEKREALNVESKKKFGTREKKLKTLQKKDQKAYEAERKALEADKANVEKAKAELESVKKEITNVKQRETRARQKCAEFEKFHPKWNTLMSEIKKLQSMKKSDEQLVVEAKERLTGLVQLFGKGNFYIELQYHGIPEEAEVMPVMAKIAKELGVPVVAANDVHFVDNTNDEFRKRSIIRALKFNKWEPERVGDKEYYIKTDKELSDSLMQILPNDIVAEAMNNVGTIFAQCNVEFPKDSHFPKAVTHNETAEEQLRRLAEAGIPLRYGDAWDDAKQKRMEYELDIINSMGYADYHCIVEDFLSYGRKIGKENPEHVGLPIGCGRGSACGSIVCYLTGITGIDPIKHDLLFERFLNPERVSMPDIDSDLSPDIRERVIDYVKGKYGEDAICCIATRMAIGAKEAIRDAARIYGSEKYDNPKYFYSLGDAMARKIPNTPNAKLSDSEDELREAFKGDNDALQILYDAKLIEGTIINVGMHAAGVIISGDGAVSNHVPLLYNKKKERWCCQCDMVEAESDAGLLKMDFLGLKNLSIITEALRSIKRHYGIALDMESIGQEMSIDGRNTLHDINGNTFDEIFAKGKTSSVFQFESSGMKNMLKRFKPENIDDVILLVAAYRPGPMQFLDDIIDVKHGRKKPEYVVPEMESILGVTYGYPIYQEQVMQIFNKFAGFTLGESDTIRRLSNIEHSL